MYRVHFILKYIIHTKQYMIPYMPLYKFPGAAEINDNKLGGLEQQKFILWSINVFPTPDHHINLFQECFG